MAKGGQKMPRSDFELKRDGDSLVIVQEIYESFQVTRTVPLDVGDPVEFLEEVFRFYLTNWNTSLDTQDKESFRKVFISLLKGVQIKNADKEAAYIAARKENMNPGDTVEVVKAFKADRTPCPKVGSIGRFVNFNRQYYFVEFDLPFEDTEGVIWEPWDDKKTMKMGFSIDEIRRVNNV
jgi:hypothetical protein